VKSKEVGLRSNILNVLEKRMNKKEKKIDSEAMKIKKIMEIDLEIDKVKNTY